jgi:hypothetical protein
MSLPQIQLVDIHGNPISADDQGDATTWPAWTDNFFWEVSDDERAALETAEFDRLCDIVDAPQPSSGERAWLELMQEGAALPPVSGGAPEPFEPSAEDWADYHAYSEELDRRRRQSSDVELSMLSAGLAIG